MILDPNEHRFRALWDRAAEAHGTDRHTLRAELQSLCDTMRKTDDAFPETPEALLLFLLAALRENDPPQE